MSEKTVSYEVEKALPPLLDDEPDPFLPGPGKMLVLGELGLTGKQNENMLVSCKVVRFTCESKAGDYNNTRGYVEVEPEGLYVHVPVFNPAQLVDEGGDVGILGYVYRQVARELDMSVFKIASERIDRAVAKADTEAAIAARRFDAGTVRKEVAQQQGEVL